MKYMYCQLWRKKKHYLMYYVMCPLNTVPPTLLHKCVCTGLCVLIHMLWERSHFVLFIFWSVVWLAVFCLLFSYLLLRVIASFIHFNNNRSDCFIIICQLQIFSTLCTLLRYNIFPYQHVSRQYMYWMDQFSHFIFNVLNTGSYNKMFIEFVLQVCACSFVEWYCAKIVQ